MASPKSALATATRRIQSKTALRHLVNSYAYDHGEEHEITLRSGMNEVSTALRSELQDRLRLAGVTG